MEENTHDDAEDCLPEILTISDARGHEYHLRVFDDDMGWTIKLFDQRTRAGQANCLKQGRDLFLADLHVLADARHPIRRFGLIKCRLGSSASGPVENYRRRGLGSALLNFVIQRARDCGFKRVTGKLFPRDLAKNPALPHWYEQRGFHVTMEQNQSSGAIEFVLA